MKKTGLLFNSKFKELRLRHKLNQAQMGEILGVKQNMISSYENQTRSPSISIAKKATEYFNVSYDEILTIDSDSAKELLSQMEESNDIRSMTVGELEKKYDLTGITEEEIKLMAATLKAHRNYQSADDN